jgi:hypothetical protein
MTETQANISNEDTEKRFKEWAQKEYVKISKFTMSKGYEFKGIDQTKCQSLPPLLGVWYINTKNKKENLWAISGSFSTDVANSEVAKNAREAIRYFSMSWHMQVAKIESGLAEGTIEAGSIETQTNFAKTLTKQAEELYKIFQSDELWANTGL